MRCVCASYVSAPIDPPAADLGGSRTVTANRRLPAARTADPAGRRTNRCPAAASRAYNTSTPPPEEINKKSTIDEYRAQGPDHAP
jgi:hypothetical protein